MTSQANNPQVEENYYQILEVPKTASLVEIRDATRINWRKLN